MSTKEQHTDDLLGETIAGKYRILTKLGEGGMGVAYRAWDEVGGVPVVIKIPKRILLEDESFVERFCREIRILQGLSHPNIVPILGVGEHEGLPYVAMRFLPGGSLSNRRLRDDSRKPMPMLPVTLHSWLPQIAAALDYVHAKGIVHRDVKPANIFFDAFSQAFLGDFGIAKIVEESEAFDKEHTLTATHMGIGTQEYMPPEQFTPKAVIDGRADQYALGVMVYEMLSGTRPFTGETAHLIVEVMTKPVPSLRAKRRDVSAPVADAVHRALSKAPNERYASCTEFAEAVLRGVPPLEVESGVARLLCPKCAKILKLSSEAAGQRGKCPNCHAKLVIADDLGALWLLAEAKRRKTGSPDDAWAGLEEDSSNGEDTGDGLLDFKPVSGSVSSARSRQQKSASKRLPSLAALGVAVVIGFGVLALLPDTPKPNRRPTADPVAVPNAVPTSEPRPVPPAPLQDSPPTLVPVAAEALGILPLAKTTPVAQSAFKGWLALSAIPAHPEGHFANAEVHVKGLQCDEYIFAHAPSRVEFTLPATAKRFEAVCVRPKGIPAGGGWACVVEVDGKQLFSQHLGDQELDLSVPIPSGGKKLSLICNQEKDPIWDTAVWCYPRIQVALPSDAVFFKDHAYWFSLDKKNRGDAHKAALVMGGQLVVIDDEEEDAFVANNVKGRTWLGITKAGQAWVQLADNAKSSFFNWAKGQPQGARRETGASTNADKAWHDHFLTERLLYCVEWHLYKPTSQTQPAAPATASKNLGNDAPQSLHVIAFDNQSIREDFFIAGNLAVNSKGELEFRGGQWSQAVTKKQFSVPLRVTFKAYAFKDKTFDFFPGILTDAEGKGGLDLHYGTHFNKATYLHICGKPVKLSHTPIRAGQEYLFTFIVNSDRKFTVFRDGEVLYSGILPAEASNRGHIRCSGGIGHSAWRQLSVQKVSDQKVQ